MTPYISYTRRLPLVEPFTPEEAEDRLYNLVSEYLRRDNLLALPASQRTLMTLVMRKLLASSTFAIAGALDTLVTRLRAQLARQAPQVALEEELEQDFEAFDETAEEWGSDDAVDAAMSEADRQALAKEIADLEQFRDLATSITANAKGEALLKAPRVAFAKAAELGAAEKAIIFTESRKTQLYLQLSIEIETGRTHGNFPARALRLVQEWAELHKAELLANWQRARDGLPLQRIAPLE